MSTQEREAEARKRTKLKVALIAFQMVKMPLNLGPETPFDRHGKMTKSLEYYVERDPAGR